MNKQHKKSKASTANKSGKILSEAQRIVNMAVSVLEEEVAAGICAAKELEESFVDLDQVRNRSPEDLMSKIRRDAHEILDIVMDSITIISDRVTKANGGMISALNTNLNGNGANSIPIISNDGEVSAGDTLEIPVSITNDQEESEMKVAFSKEDLRGKGENKILSRNFRLVPEELTVQPNETKVLILRIKLPKLTKAGKYSGMFINKHNVSTRMVLELTVQPSPHG